MSSADSTLKRESRELEAPVLSTEHEGPRKALADLARDHHRALLRFLTARTGSQDEAKEIAQEAYAKMLALDRPEAVGFLAGYLWQLAKNIAIDRKRQRDTRARLDQDVLPRTDRHAPSAETIVDVRPLLLRLSPDVPMCGLVGVEEGVHERAWRYGAWFVQHEGHFVIKRAISDEHGQPAGYQLLEGDFDSLARMAYIGCEAVGRIAGLTFDLPSEPQHLFLRDGGRIVRMHSIGHGSSEWWVICDVTYADGTKLAHHAVNPAQIIYATDGPDVKAANAEWELTSKAVLVYLLRHGQFDACGRWQATRVLTNPDQQSTPRPHSSPVSRLR